MKTKTWIWILSLVLIACLGLSAFLLWPRDADFAQVYSNGKLLYMLDLHIDRTVTVQTDGGTNTVTVKDGTIAVTQADCPDGYCMDRGFCSGGAQIVCLPNRLVIRFVGGQTVDGVAG